MVKERTLTYETESGLIVNIYGVKGTAGKEAEYFTGDVIAVSDKVHNIKAGDVVLFDCYSGGYDLEIDEQEYFITKPNNIWAVVGEA